MGFEQPANGDGAPSSTFTESPFLTQLIAQQGQENKEVKQAEVKPGEVKPGEVKPAEVKPVEAKTGELVPEGRGGAPGGAPGGTFHPPTGSPGRGGEPGGGRPPVFPRPPEGGQTGGGRGGEPGGGRGGEPGGGRGGLPGGDNGKDPGKGKGPGGDNGKDPGKGKGPGGDDGKDPGKGKGPGGDTGRHPHPPVGEPSPGDPHHGFHPGRPFEPPVGRGWGWQDENRWRRGWDPFFFQQDPNWRVWQTNIEAEADYVAGLLDSGNAAAAANELNQDMFEMRGDIYAQDHLLNRVNTLEVKGVGADLNLGPWDPIRGTWDNITITPDPADTITPVQTVDPFDRFGNPL